MIRVEDWGLVDYEEALGRQRTIFEELVELRLRSSQPEAVARGGVIVFCEHPPVFTLGRNGDEGNILAAHEMRRRGAKIVRTDRGGDVTFHGPGQLVCYPILDLERLGFGLREYIGLLEQAVIETLAEFGIEGVRSDKGAGVWVHRPERAAQEAKTQARPVASAGASEGSKSGGKICAIGVRASRGVVMHGLALNVSTDPEWFRMINPCGMAGEPVTSVEAERKPRLFCIDEKASEAERLMEHVREVLEKKLLKMIYYADRKTMGDSRAG